MTFKKLLAGIFLILSCAVAGAIPSHAAAATSPAWLGTSTTDLTQKQSQKLGIPEGATVAVVYAYPDSPAAKAGLHADDVLLRVDGEAVISSAGLNEILNRRVVGQTLNLEIFRKDAGVLKLSAVAAAIPTSDEQQRLVRSAAESGVPLFEYAMGISQQNVAEGVKWLLSAAGHGQSDAQTEIARLQYFEPATGVHQPQAETWLREAANNGNGKAQYILGLLLLQGRLGPVDSTQALLWFRRSAEAGNREGITSMGASYEYGYGVPKNKEKAIYWYQKAAAMGEPTAKESLRRLGTSQTN